LYRKKENRRRMIIKNVLTFCNNDKVLQRMTDK